MTFPVLPRRHAGLVLILTALGACVTQPAGRYPSLLPRAIEMRSDAEPLAAPVAPAAAEPATDATLADLRKALDANVAAFAAAADTADRLARAAKGDAVGGERWIAAQTALGGLDGYRATTSAIVSDVDALALARVADGKAEYPGVTALHDAAQAALDAQSARIAEIGARLPEA